MTTRPQQNPLIRARQSRKKQKTDASAVADLMTSESESPADAEEMDVLQEVGVRQGLKDQLCDRLRVNKAIFWRKGQEKAGLQTSIRKSENLLADAEIKAELEPLPRHMNQINRSWTSTRRRSRTCVSGRLEWVFEISPMSSCWSWHLRISPRGTYCEAAVLHRRPRLYQLTTPNWFIRLPHLFISYTFDETPEVFNFDLFCSEHHPYDLFCDHLSAAHYSVLPRSLRTILALCILQQDLQPPPFEFVFDKYGFGEDRKPHGLDDAVCRHVLPAITTVTA
ncbi:hypothetical protein BV898_00806 [Hypsibius exemplaris]|uniref:Uncharacterized protein n=1 Tax=Hypsibius exemplaris TaxID=2072580 RepID=A0A1W0XCC4_HYPEX|nr:hypothetical protein BV898_00806 [Hypsibius exemplaris]